MALIHATFKSINLGREVNIVVTLPELVDREGFRVTGIKSPDTRFKTLYLLHGMSGNEWDWVRLTGIERYATAKGIAVVMPAGEDLFYVNGPRYNYADFIGEELVGMTRLMFPLSEKREDTFVAGLSMGGYGAMHTLLNFPDTFCAGASFSGVLDAVGAAEQSMNNQEARTMGVWQSSFGDISKMKGSENDLFYMAEKLQKEGRLPAIYFACGTEDFLYQGNIKFRDFLKGLGAEFTYEEGPGSHTWEFWDEYVQHALDWFPIG